MATYCSIMAIIVPAMFTSDEIYVCFSIVDRVQLQELNKDYSNDTTKHKTCIYLCSAKTSKATVDEGPT